MLFSILFGDLAMGLEIQGELLQQQIHIGNKFQNLSKLSFREASRTAPHYWVRELSNYSYWEIFREKSLTLVLNPSPLMAS